MTILNKETGDCHSQRNSHPSKVRAALSKQKANNRRFGRFYYLVNSLKHSDRMRPVTVPRQTVQFP